MMSRGKITPGSLSYYTDVVASGVEDYYAGRGEAPGFWTGSGARAAGIDGEVSAAQLQRLFAFAHPVTGEPLGNDYVVPGDRDKVYGWDLTVSAPKTVSSLWAVDASAGLEVRDAHDVAVQTAIAYLETHAAFSRQGKAGVRQVDTDGLVIAAFVHRTSRTGDPQLHTHLLVSNRVRCEDGVWRALDSKALHPQIKPAGMIYQAALRAELTRRLGVEWGPVSEDGQADILGVPDALTENWSSRRKVIVAEGRRRITEREAELGRKLTKVERRIELERAVLDTRPRKDLDGVTDQGLHDSWAADAERLGHPAASWVGDTVGRERGVVTIATPDVVARQAVAELEASQSTWTRADLVMQVSRRAPGTLRDAEAARRWVEDTVDLALAHHRVLAIAAPEPAPPASLQRRDGRSVYDPHNATRYTTKHTVEVEQRVLDAVAGGRDAHRAVAAVSHVEDAVERFGLDNGQAAVVARVTRGGEAVTCVVGPAGAGKSRTMGAAAAAWQHAGIPVRGLAVSASAAGVLAAEAGIRADTIAKLLYEHDRPEGPGDDWLLRPGEVVIVDEAGMTSSSDLARIITLATQAEAKVVLVGDHRQLDAIQAGGLFRLLAHDSNAAELHTLHRFSNPWEADASLELRDQKPSAIRAYAEHGRIGADDRLAVIDDAVTRWHVVRDSGSSVVICARDHDTVDDINTRIRAHRVEAGHVHADGVTVGKDTAIGIGDEIVTLRNNRLLLTSRGGWVRNGDRWTVQSTHADGSLSVDDLIGRGRVTLPAAYVAEHVDLAYALTIHKAQGVTVDRSVLVADAGLSAEALYVGMTRGRHDNTVLVVTDPLDLDRHHHPEPLDPVAVLTNALARATSERAAIDEIRHAFARSESLAVLKPRLANLDAWIRERTPIDHSIDLEKARRRLAECEDSAKPGRLTRRGREDRQLLDTLTERVTHYETHEHARAAWHDEHADTFAFRDELANKIAKRGLELGWAAAADPPDHLTDLLGACPGKHPARSRWIFAAARVEAYREEWDVDPADVRRAPTDGTQRRDWNAAIERPIRLRGALQTTPAEPRDHANELERETRREAARERDFGIEL